MLMVLISGQLQKSAWRNAFGRNCHSVRGYVWPDAVGGEAPAPYLAGAIGFRIDAWNEDPLDVDNNPFAQPDEDWMGWLPYFPLPSCRCRPAVGDYLEHTGLSLRRRHQGTEEAGRAEPDSLDVLHSPREGVITYNWDLSIGLKLP